jgi:ribonuclease BN (tRNA processing enzyme)
MYRTTHPEQTISYKFIEMPTGKTFVFLTDHECTAALPMDLATHLRNADLLIADGQYSKDRYEATTAGYGHATPEYCAQLAYKCGVKALGITHHDPFASDAEVSCRVAEARLEFEILSGKTLTQNVFACACYQEVEV